MAGVVVVQVALLMLLCTWTAGCAAAAAGVLRARGAAAWLAAQVGGADDEGEGLLQALAAFQLALCIYYNDDSVEDYSKVTLPNLPV